MAHRPVPGAETRRGLERGEQISACGRDRIGQRLASTQFSRDPARKRTASAMGVTGFYPSMPPFPYASLRAADEQPIDKLVRRPPMIWAPIKPGHED